MAVDRAHRARGYAPDAEEETPSLSLVIPLFNEEGNVEPAAMGLLEAFRRAGVELQLLLVDNGSRDGTRAEVQALEEREVEIEGVYLDKNAGYGGGILAGMGRADRELMGWMWGDDQISASDTLRVYRRLVMEQADVAKARRIRRDDGWQREVVTRVYNALTLWLFHIPSPDTNGCPKIFRREAFERLAPASRDWFLDPEVMIGYCREGLKLAEVDVVARPRTRGVSKVKAATVGEFVVNLVRARAAINRSKRAR